MGSKVPKVAILGGGITALSLGWYLQQQGVEFSIYEQSDRAGGSIQTEERGGFLIETGPRTLRTSGIETLKLIEALGLQDQVIGSETLDRYLYLNQKMQKVSFFSPLARKYLIPFLQEAFKPKGNLEDESVYAFAKRRYNTQIAKTFFDPLVTGIYAGDMEKLSMRACFPSLFNLEKKHGSLLKGMLFARKKPQPMSPFVRQMQKYPLFSFQKGLSTLTKELAERLKGHIQYHKKAAGVQGTKITFADQSHVEADHIFCTIPLNSQVERVSLTAVHLGYHSNTLPFKAFGYLIPRTERERILGVVFDSAVFPSQQPGKLCLTVMVSGVPEEAIDWALEAVARHLGLKQPDLITCSRHPHAIPQYPVGYQPRANEEHITFLGSSYTGISVNDCIAKAHQTANCHPHLMETK
jgi:protoporphyrinogen/coproporphyrinogen III oxidase